MFGFKYCQYHFVVLLTISLLVACGGGDSDDAAVDSDNAERNTITGVVYDESGSPVANATIYTLPATEQVTTNSNGAYVISDTSVGSSGEMNYTVYARKAGFTTNSTTVALGSGTDNIADLTINRSVNGLVASDLETGLSISLLKINNDSNEANFVLSSTTANNTYSFDTGNVDWLTLSTSSGSIDNITQKIVTITVDKSNLSEGVHSATITGNGNTSEDISLVVKVAVGSGVTIVDETSPSTGSTSGTSTETGTTSGADNFAPFGTELNYAYDGFSYTFTPSYCQLAGTEITCYMTVKANGKDAPLYLGNGLRGLTVIDGEPYPAQRISIAGQDYSTIPSSESAITLRSDVSYQAVINFPDVPSNATLMDYMIFYFEARSSGGLSIDDQSFSPAWMSVVIN